MIWRRVTPKGTNLPRQKATALPFGATTGAWFRPDCVSTVLPLPSAAKDTIDPRRDTTTGAGAVPLDGPPALAPAG
jgi:hypothetical protein